MSTRERRAVATGGVVGIAGFAAGTGAAALGLLSSRVAFGVALVSLAAYALTLGVGVLLARRYERGVRSRMAESGVEVPSARSVVVRLAPTASGAARVLAFAHSPRAARRRGPARSGLTPMS